MQGRAITLPIYLLRKGDRASYFADLGGALPVYVVGRFLYLDLGAIWHNKARFCYEEKKGFMIPVHSPFV